MKYYILYGAQPHFLSWRRSFLHLRSGVCMLFSLCAMMRPYQQVLPSTNKKFNGLQAPSCLTALPQSTTS